MNKKEKEFINRITPWALALAVMIMSNTIYSNAIDNDYNLDDELVTNNHALQNVDFSKMKSLDFKLLGNLFTEPYYQDPAGNKYEYRPMVMVSFFFEFWLYGKKPTITSRDEALKYAAISHRINVWTYVITCVLIFYLLLLLFRNVKYRYGLAFVTTLLFVVHPLHTEAVASIKNRDELLSMFFGVTAWICALKSVDSKHVLLKILSYLLYLLLFLAAIFSKQTTITFSLLIPASVILFRKVNFWYYLALVFPVVFIASTFAPIYLLYKKAVLFIGAMLFLVAFYFFMSKREQARLFLKRAGASTKTFFTTKVNYKLVSIVAVVFVILFLGVFIITKVNQKAAEGLKKAEFAITDPVNDFNELQLRPLLQQPAPSVIPVAGRKLAFVETPLIYVDNNEKIGTSLYALGYYLKLMFIPYPLSFYYGYNQIPITGIGNGIVLLSLLVYLAISVAIVYLLYKRKHPIAAFGLLYFLVAMIPLSNLLTPIAGIVAERLSFSASLGFCIAFCYFLFYPLVDSGAALIKKIGMPTALYGSIGIFVFIILLFSTLTFQRNKDWKDHLTLFEADMGHLQNSARAHHLYASHLAYSTIGNPRNAENMKKLQKAVPEFQKALEIYPDFPYAWFDLAKTYLLMGDNNDAINAYIKSTQKDTLFAPPFFELGVVLADNKRYNEAEVAYLNAIKRDSTFLQAYTNLSYLYYMMQRFDKSIHVNQLALRRMPNSYEPLVNLGKTYMTLRDTTNGLFYLEQAIAVNRTDKTLLNGVADVYRAKGDLKKEEYYRAMMR